ncbi:hypothetical protein THAOC_35867, partial [Thalassiosira oceanica]
MPAVKRIGHTMCRRSTMKVVEDEISPELRRPWPEDEDPGASSLAAALSSFYNRWTYSYMNEIFAKGALQKKDRTVQLTQDDLFMTPELNEATRLNERFWVCYEETNRNFARTLWLLSKPTFIPAGVCQLFSLTAQLIIPLLVRKLLQAAEKFSGVGNIIDETKYYVLGIFLLSMTNALCTHRYQLLSYQTGIVIRTAVACAVYEHSLKLSPKGREGLTSGNVTNLVATDTQKLFEVFQQGHMIWAAPLGISIVVVILFVLIGPSSFVGAAILIGLVPLSKQVVHVIVRIRRKRVAVADERIEIINAMLQHIKVTKLNNYEDRFETRVREARAREMALIRKEQIVWGFTMVIRVFTPVVASFATYTTYVLVDEGNIMTASTVFTIALLLNMIKFPINEAGVLLSKAALGVQAMHRISMFMKREVNDAHAVSTNDVTTKQVLQVDGAFLIGRRLGDPTNNPDEVATASFTLSGIDFSVNRGEVVAVVGSVASGKSTLLQGVLGDVDQADGTTVARDDNVAYASQTPFVLSATVRQNILFGSPFDEDRYERVLDACCLRPDLLQFPAGDLTEIGERGVTMSGGQRQRVSVARAVDIRSGLLKESGVLLVTHAVHVLPQVDKILVLNEGQQVFFGTYEELQVFESNNPRHMSKLKSIRSSMNLSKMDISSKSSERHKGVCNSPAQSAVARSVDAKKGEIIAAEQREHGGAALSVWLLWFRYAGGFMFILTQVLFMTGDRGHRGIWRYFSEPAGWEPDPVLAGILRDGRVHADIPDCKKPVLHAPMSYFDTTPLGRVLNRFWLVAGQIVMISLVPYLAVVNLCIFSLYIIILRHYRWSAADLQRLDAVSRSPIQASLAEGLDGAFTIKAYGKNSFFAAQFQQHNNGNSAAMLNFVASRRWLAVRIESMGAVVILCASLFISVFTEQLGLTPGLTGLLLVWASGFTVVLSFLITSFSEAEAAITSMERMHDLEQLPQESCMETACENAVVETWPAQGELAFHDVSMRYREGLPLSLEDLSFTVEPRQRCAVVGRTGAGKSSLTAALFRLVEIERGKITLDGVDLSTLGLKDVRGRRNGMFILPQDPAVFSGTIRTNIDPFNIHEESDILNALASVKFPGAQDGVALLDKVVEEGGSNFSVGELQLLCLARAMIASPRL